MIFLSVDISPSYVMKPGSYKIVETGMGPMVDLDRGYTLQFEPLSEFLETRLLPAKRGVRGALGRLDTTKVSAELGLDESIIIEFLTGLEVCGRDFAPVNADGDQEAEPDDYYIVPVGNDYFCKLCDRTFRPKGRGGHVKSKQHRAALQELTDKGQAQLAELAAEAADVSEASLARTMKMAEASKGGEQHTSG